MLQECAADFVAGMRREQKGKKQMILLLLIAGSAS